MKINDYVFEFIEKGKGETVVFVHGSVSDYRTWQKQQEEFSNRLLWGQFHIAEDY